MSWWINYIYKIHIFKLKSINREKKLLCSSEWSVYRDKVLFWFMYAMIKKCIAGWFVLASLISLLWIPLMDWWYLCIPAAVRLFFLPKKNIITGYRYDRLSYALLQEDVYKNNISVFSAICLVCKMRLFPMFLFLYLIYLFIEQTHFLQLQFSRFFLWLHAWLLLVVLAVTGICATNVTDWTLHTYVRSLHSPYVGWLYVIVCLAMSLLGSRVVGQQTISLWWIGYVISIVSGVLIVLMSFLLLEYDTDHVSDEIV